MPNPMEGLLDRFKDSSILVIGDLMLDEYIQGTVERISPEAPVPIVRQRNVKVVPGGAGNVVNNLVSLGARVSVVGASGNDADAQILQRLFLDQGVREKDLFILPLENRPTTKKTRIMAANQQICRLDREIAEPVGAEEEKSLLANIARRLNDVSGIIFSDYDKGIITPNIIQKTVEMASSRKIFISVDPQVTHFNYYRNVAVLTPNHHEAGGYLGRKLLTPETVREGGFEIMERLNSKMLLITQGEKGMTLFQSSDKSCQNFPTLAREVFDVTGAGDTVISIFTLAMTAGALPRDAVLLSNKGAGIVVGRLGAAVVTVEELKEGI